EDLAQRAAELEHPALALADRGGLYGAPRFHQAAQAEGVRAIVGAELDLDAGPPGARVLLLVESREGYGHLARLLTRGHGAGPSPGGGAAARAGSGRSRKAGCRVSWDDVEAHAAGLVALLRGDATLALESLDRARACFGPGRLWVDVSRHLDAAAERDAR